MHKAVPHQEWPLTVTRDELLLCFRITKNEKYPECFWKFTESFKRHLMLVAPEPVALRGSRGPFCHISAGVEALHYCLASETI